MPVVRMQPRNSEMVLIREVRDTAGRTDEQIRAMEQNDPKPPYITGTDRLYADQIADEWKVYPKVMYHLAVKEKKAADGTVEYILKGDRINPNYPMPYALAMENGFQGQITGHGSDKGVNVVHPYKTCYVPLNWDPNFPVSIDFDACRKDEANLAAKGWVDNPNKLNIPKRLEDPDDFDSLPDLPAPPPKKRGRPKRKVEVQDAAH